MPHDILLLNRNNSWFADVYSIAFLFISSFTLLVIGPSGDHGNVWLISCSDHHSPSSGYCYWYWEICRIPHTWDCQKKRIKRYSTGPLFDRLGTFRVWYVTCILSIRSVAFCTLARSIHLLTKAGKRPFWNPCKKWTFFILSEEISFINVFKLFVIIVQISQLLRTYLYNKLQ
jgi:hypothetical protein